MAGDLSFPEPDGMVSRSVSDAPPIHYLLKIQSFSQLAKNNIDKYTSNDFEAGGYKWKLVIHPNGNRSKSITDHISAYLVISEGNSLPPGWEIRAIFRLFLLDQNKNIYLTLQDTVDKGRRFYGMKREWGFDTFVPHKTFNDSANGYLANDTCAFGAEVYVCLEKHAVGKGEDLSMIKDAISYKNTVRFENFSNLLTGECVDSKPFDAANNKWKVQLYPRGKGTVAGSHVSLYLTLAEPQNISSNEIYARFTLRILDQLNGKHDSGESNYWFSASNSTRGWPRFVSQAYFNQSNAGLLVKNICLVEVELTVHGVANAL